MIKVKNLSADHKQSQEPSSEMIVSGPLPGNRRASDANKNPRLQHAMTAHNQGRLDEAIRIYNVILSETPEDKQVWNNLGVALRKQEKYAAAAACYKIAIELDPTWPGGWSNYGNVLKDLDKLEESLAAHKRAYDLDPKAASHHHHMGIALRLLGRHEEALWHFEETIRIDPNHIMANWDLARSYLCMGDYKRGWQQYEWRWKLEEMKVRDFQAKRWNGESLKHKKILLYAEQGFGDTLLGLRFAPWVKEQGPKHVAFESQGPLKRLIQNIPGIDSVSVRDEELPKTDWQSSLMSLPRLYGLTLDTLPPPPKLTWFEEDRLRFKKILDAICRPTELRVGIIWSGSVTFKNNHKRSVSLDRFIDFASIPNVRLISLQKGPRQRDLQELDTPRLVMDLGQHIKDFADTAAAMQELDLIVMTDSSAAHLAGCLDIPVWNLLDFEAYWLYLLHREDTPWYPSMRFYRQPSPDDWDAVFTRVAGDLCGIAARKAAGQRDLKSALLPHQFQAQ